MSGGTGRTHRWHLPDWAEERGRILNAFDSIDAARTALVVVDMQQVFVAPDAVFGNPYAEGIVPAVNRLAQAMRAAGGMVIWTRETLSEAPGLAMPDWQYDRSIPEVAQAMATMEAGAPGHALYAAMEVGAGDMVIDKYRYGAFSCPAGALEAALRACGADMLLIVGTLTNVCCESTAREANMRGYKVILVADATAAVTDEEQNAALLNLRLNFADVWTEARVLEALGQGG